jgi:hypothetical protein
MAPDQGQRSYINRYIVYLLVAHRVQRDYVDGLRCQVCISDDALCKNCMSSQRQCMSYRPSDTSDTLKINTSVNRITTVLHLLTASSRINGSASGGAGGL